MMRNIKMVVILAVICLFALCGNGWAKKAATLTDADCIKCHPQQPVTIESQGGKHKTEVGCMDCHLEHGPLGKETIPKCDMCHSGTPHYELKDCSVCHVDPHAPLGIQLGPEVTAGCLTCHPQQGQEMKTFPSMHAEQDCSLCHPEEHKEFLECAECHEPHTPEMTYKDCLSCHPPHKPLEITYEIETPSKTCAPCHAQAYDLLLKNTTKHHDLTCAFCHREKHGNIPPCQACHGTPHSPDLHKKFPKCGECHGIAHNLVK